MASSEFKCQFFNGFQHEECLAGVKYSEVPGDINNKPCLRWCKTDPRTGQFFGCSAKKLHSWVSPEEEIDG